MTRYSKFSLENMTMDRVSQTSIDTFRQHQWVNTTGPTKNLHEPLREVKKNKVTLAFPETGFSHLAESLEVYNKHIRQSPQA